MGAKDRITGAKFLFSSGIINGMKSNVYAGGAFDETMIASKPDRCATTCAYRSAGDISRPPVVMDKFTDVNRG